MHGLTRKYGFFTITAMVVGIVIGSGVFYKAQEILVMLNGNIPLGIFAWAIGGFVMLSCAMTFAIMASMYENVGGVVDYAEVCLGEKYAYYLSWFLSTIHYPSLTSVLAWVSARFVGALFGWDMRGADVMMLSGVLLITSYAINTLSPKLAGKFQVSTTIIKLIPLALMAVVGTIAGVFNGNIIEHFSTNSEKVDVLSVFGAIVATAFAYEGWIIATSINAEVKNSKKNLPRALLLGGILIVVVYILYYIGISGSASMDLLMKDGATAAFISLFGKRFGIVLNVFVAISCLGTLNGLMLATIRGYYVTATRLKSQRTASLLEINAHTNIPNNSGIIGLLTVALWLLYFYGANIGGGWFGVFNFDSSELPIITIYAFYIPIFISFTVKEKGLSKRKRFLFPILSIFSSIFIILATIYAHGMRPFIEAKEDGCFAFPVIFYLIIFTIIMGIGAVIRTVIVKESPKKATD